MYDIAKIISVGLARKRMTQAELAKKLEVSRPQVSKWISGVTMPTADKLLDIIMILEIEDDLFPKLTKEKFESTGLVAVENGQIESVLERLDKLEGKYSLINKDSVDIINELSKDEIKFLIELMREFGKDTIVKTAEILKNVKQEPEKQTT